VQGKVVFHARTVVRQLGFDQAAAGIYGTVQRADDALEGLVTAVSHQPVTAATSLVHNGPPPLYAIKMVATPAWPGVVVFYSFDANNVYLEQIIKSSIPPA
jgi:hypothetical protein